MGVIVRARVQIGSTLYNNVTVTVFVYGLF